MCKWWQLLLIFLICFFIGILTQIKNKQNLLKKIVKGILIGIVFTIIIFLINMIVYLKNGEGFIINILNPRTYIIGTVRNTEEVGVLFCEIEGINKDGTYIYNSHKEYSVPDIKEANNNFYKVIICHNSSIRESYPASFSKIKSVEVISEEEAIKEIKKLNEEK